MKITVLFLMLCQVTISWAFTKGFNQAWLKDKYAYQWLDQYFDESYSKKVLKLNNESGSGLLRIWLYEGSNLRQFNLSPNKQTLELKPEVLRNLATFLRLARKYNTKINITFLDANAFKNVGSLKDFWWNVFNDKYGGLEHFYQVGVAPIYKLIKDEFSDVVTQIDLVNEVNALEAYHQFASPTVSMTRFLCKLKKGSPVPVTASIGWAQAEEVLLGVYLNNSCLDFFDIHLYNDSGQINYCSQFKSFAQKGYVFQLGEFGQKSKHYDDLLQSLVTKKFMENAYKCGFKSALAWRLDDTRDGYNTEARYSYYAHGMKRPAADVFKNLSFEK